MRTGGETHHVVERRHGRPTGRPECGPPAKSPRDLRAHVRHRPLLCALAAPSRSKRAARCPQHPLLAYVSYPLATRCFRRDSGPPLTVGEVEQRTCPLGRVLSTPQGPSSLWSHRGRAPLGRPWRGEDSSHPGLLSQRRGDRKDAVGPAGPTCVHDPVNLH